MKCRRRSLGRLGYEAEEVSFRIISTQPTSDDEQISDHHGWISFGKFRSETKRNRKLGAGAEFSMNRQ